MKFMAFMPGDNQEVFFSTWSDALQAANEIGFTFFFPRKGIFSTEPQKKVVVLRHGRWETVLISDLECTCGCCK